MPTAVSTKSALVRLAEAIGYPERVSEGAKSFTFTVDERDIVATEAKGVLRLRSILMEPTAGEADDAKLLRLAEFAAGRVLREDAVLAWEPELEALILWQEISAKAEAEDLREFLEVFATSLDWWSDRVAEEAAVPTPAMPEFVIRP